MLIIEEYLETLLKQLNRKEKIYPDENQIYVLAFENDIKIDIRDLDPGFYFYCRFHPVPEKNLDVIFSAIMAGNLFGEGTGGGLVGLDKETKMLTLSMALPYRISYQEFRDHVEDFTNYVGFWREEIIDIEEGKASVLLP